jgi:hypothetical protein
LASLLPPPSNAPPIGSNIEDVIDDSQDAGGLTALLAPGSSLQMQGLRQRKTVVEKDNA